MLKVIINDGRSRLMNAKNIGGYNTGKHSCYGNCVVNTRCITRIKVNKVPTGLRKMRAHLEKSLIFVVSIKILDKWYKT